MSESGLEIVAARRFVAIDLITKIIVLEMMLRMMDVVMIMTFFLNITKFYLLCSFEYRPLQI